MGSMGNKVNDGWFSFGLPLKPTKHRVDKLQGKVRLSTVYLLNIAAFFFRLG